MIRVAVDAMGGDHAPQAEVEGSLLALGEYDDLHVQLVGRPEVLAPVLAAQGAAGHPRLSVVEAPEVIGMAEKPLAAIRAKRKSSIVVGLALQKSGESEAFLSAGSRARSKGWASCSRAAT